MEEIIDVIEVIEEEQVIEPVVTVIEQTIDISSIENMLYSIITHQNQTNTILLWFIGIFGALLVLLVLYKFIRIFF